MDNGDGTFVRGLKSRMKKEKAWKVSRVWLSNCLLDEGGKGK